MWQRFVGAQGSFRRSFKPVLTSIHDTGFVLIPIDHQATFGRRGAARALAPQWRQPRWKIAGVLALLCSTVAWASFPRAADIPRDEPNQWQALGLAPLSLGGVTGMPMEPTEAVTPVEFVPKRAAALPSVAPVAAPALVATGPIRIRGRVGDGLYWSLRAAGASPQVAAAYLAALATEIDVGDVAPNDSFDMVLSPSRDLLYAGLSRVAESSLELVKWTAGGRSEWIDAANASRPEPVESGMMMPANGPITSYFGYRYHPILHFTRFHAGVDIGAGWGSPIVAAGDGRVVNAGWSGGYGREVEIAHGGGLVSIYGHMSDIVAQSGSFVRRGQLIGYVGSSGLSTGPHVHFEVRQGGQPVNPLAVRFVSAPVVDTHLADAVKARLKQLLAIASAAGAQRPL
jgi:murein DD-endopeptidase MepM/ murein hydrolase activator NlpD